MHRVDEALGLLGIEYLRHRAPHHLSGGEKKRVAIAGVLAMEPDVLVMDEPTAGLDPRGRDDLVRFVNSLAEKYGMTVIFSTHELELVTAMADYIYVMDQGRILAQGSVQEIFEQEEMLRRIRLDVPVIPKLCRALRRRGRRRPGRLHGRGGRGGNFERPHPLPPAMIEDLFEIERLAYGDSTVHRLDARVKLVLTFGAIIALVAYPVHESIYLLAGVLGALLVALLLVSRVPLRAYLLRVAVILPFGLSILLLQVLFPPVPFPDPTVLLSLPFGIAITTEALAKASMIGVRFVLCIGFVVLLSSTTRLQDLLTGARRLGLPSEFTLILGMMARYLFVFGQMFLRVRNALATRCFDPFDRSLPYGYRIRQAREHGRDDVPPVVRAGGADVHGHALPGLRPGRLPLRAEEGALPPRLDGPRDLHGRHLRGTDRAGARRLRRRARRVQIGPAPSPCHAPRDRRCPPGRVAD